MGARGFGVTRVGGSAVTPDTLFQAASISKPVTAMAVLHLVESGKLGLDTDVNQYLKTWKVPTNTFTEKYQGHAAGIANPSGWDNRHAVSGLCVWCRSSHRGAGAEWREARLTLRRSALIRYREPSGGTRGGRFVITQRSARGRRLARHSPVLMHDLSCSRRSG